MKTKWNLALTQSFVFKHIICIFYSYQWFLNGCGIKKSKGWIYAAKNIWQHLETSLAVTTGVRGISCTEARDAIKPATKHRTAPTAKAYPDQMSTVPTTLVLHLKTSFGVARCWFSPLPTQEFHEVVEREEGAQSALPKDLETSVHCFSLHQPQSLHRGSHIA